MFFRLKLPSILSAAVISVGLTAFGSVTALAAPNVTCKGGTVAPGTYGTLAIAGVCQVDGGDVTVQRDLVVKAGAVLIAAYGGSNLNVGGKVSVGSNAVLVIGCEPDEFQCFNDPDNVSTTFDTIGSLVAHDAVGVIVHATTITGAASVVGGGGGLNCNPIFPGGPPPYSDFTDNTIGGDATVVGLQTCWDGFFRNHVAGSVKFSRNQTVLGDGNLMGQNTIAHDLTCFGNSPKPHLSDAPNPVVNTVGGTTRGQCKALI
jgi:hypothetical protein